MASPPVDEVNVDIYDEDERRENIRQRLRNYTLNTINGMLSPLVTYSRISPLSLFGLNNNNDDNNGVSTSNVSVTISDQFENLAVSVDISQNAGEPNENGSNPPIDNNQNESNPNVFQQDDTENNNNENNRTTVDVNINEYIPEIIKCLLFVAILLIKFLYDHLEGLLTFVCLHVIMCMFIGAEQINLRSKSTWRTVLDFLCILKCLSYIYYYDGLPCTLVVYNHDYKSPTDIWNLLWIIYMNDCAIKFVTMGSKLIVKFIPHKLMLYKTKLRVYFFFEACSHLYRSTIPIQPWVSFFLILYEESAYILCVFMSSAYLLLKTYDIYAKLNVVRIALQKLLQGTVYLAPSSEHMATIGTKCSVCLDDFEHPVLLSCQHVFCSTCITQWATKNKSCPLCRTPMVEDFAPKNILTALYIQLF